MEERYEAVLFDFDGVLVDSEPVHYRCWRQVLLPFGFDLHWDMYHQHFIGISDRKMVDAIVALSPVPLSAEVIYAQYPVKREMFRVEMEREVPFSPGVRELFRDLGGFKIAVVTSSLQAEVEPVLQSSGLLLQLGTVVYGGDVAHLKPHPEPYQKAARALGVKRALVVEDSAAGEASGRAAGFDVVRVPSADRMTALVRAQLGL